MSNEKILVVDDDKNICELLRLYLVKEGYGVTIANDGTAALQEFDKLHPAGAPGPLCHRLLPIHQRQHRTIPALRLKHRSGSCGTASALPKCSIRHPVLSALLA